MDRIFVVHCLNGACIFLPLAGSIVIQIFDNHAEKLILRRQATKRKSMLLFLLPNFPLYRHVLILLNIQIESVIYFIYCV